MMMRNRVVLMVVGLVFGVFASEAQDRSKADEYKLQQEQIKRAMVLRELDSGVQFLDMGNYVAADLKFQYVLKNVKSVPSDLTFYFGKNSYYLEKYKQSIDWLNKYIQLKGTNGQFSQEATQLLKRAEAEYLKEQYQAANQAATVLSSDYDIDCGPSGKVVCPVCKGDHVITKQGAFGLTYQTCKYCNEHGLLTCEEYNLLLRGELKPKL